jgi:hypothetical protein
MFKREFNNKKMENCLTYLVFQGHREIESYSSEYKWEDGCCFGYQLNFMTIAQNFVKQKKIAGKQRWRKLL